ncbi:DUF1624 domain-containing protein [Larkinella sp. VNQ87]|uniref:DUF1624 domain-containing protein n=1 Tax=Larkinella sp. VNQ87 TaxID=3400921 RepID=UPI003C00A68F
MSVTLTPPINRVASRIQRIDVVRGLVMVIMALDHTREYIHKNGFFYNPLDLNTTTPALFLTRWVTHFCAPTFVFLAGTSAYLMGRKKSKPELSIFLLTRGLWLMVLELTIVNFNLWFDLTFSVIALEVIWATGVSMVVLSGLLFLPYRVLLAIGLLIVFGHNALDPVSFPPGTTADLIWSMLHRPNIIPIAENRRLLTLYPVLAWIGILILGYCLGPIFSREIDSEKRRRFLGWLGLGAILAFVLIRSLNVYGDPVPWAVQKSFLYTIFSFINVNKYPPSLLFTLVTLGPGIWLLSRLEEKKRSWMSFFTVYGRVPLFYFIVHFLLVHTLSVLLLLTDGVSWSAINFQNGTGGVMPDHGLSLGQTYGMWILVVLIMYPLCKRYGRVKSRSSNPIWSYL